MPHQFMRIMDATNERTLWRELAEATMVMTIVPKGAGNLLVALSWIFKQPRYARPPKRLEP